ncbi:hypothetical protein FB451DRAFT_1562382 [Mycena latifolia]|nr:hypothetical protein FB451DRAFT_1562382 [Mycena latifolia]
MLDDAQLVKHFPTLLKALKARIASLPDSLSAGQEGNPLARYLELLSYIDAHTDALIARLSKASVIPSISGDPAFRQNVRQMSNCADWLNTRTPALTYGLRGLVYFKPTVSGPARDLHWDAGVFGRTVHEPMTDLVALMGRLGSPAGNILVPGWYLWRMRRSGAPIYDKLDYSIADVEGAAGAPIALSADKVRVFMGRMRLPSLPLHGIEGAFAGPGAKTGIPAKVGGKFSIRCVRPFAPRLPPCLLLFFRILRGVRVLVVVRLLRVVLNGRWLSGGNVVYELRVYDGALGRAWNERRHGNS